MPAAGQTTQPCPLPKPGILNAQTTTAQPMFFYTSFFLTWGTNALAHLLPDLAGRRPYSSTKLCKMPLHPAASRSTLSPISSQKALYLPHTYSKLFCRRFLPQPLFIQPLHYFQSTQFLFAYGYQIHFYVPFFEGDTLTRTQRGHYY
jgi:hypothetical protein